tara:strand:+ start:1952 stop:2161 length:210 start_codon:yes stop_codon:yes gene_type:complete
VLLLKAVGFIPGSKQFPLKEIEVTDDVNSEFGNINVPNVKFYNENLNQGLCPEIWGVNKTSQHLGSCKA